MRPLNPTTLLAALVLIIGTSACGSDKGGKDSGPAAGTSGGTTQGGTQGGTTSTAGYQIQATAIDWETKLPAAEGLCIDLIDPSPALTGGKPLTLVSTTVGPKGAVVFDGVITSSLLGLLSSVKDCGTENVTVFTSPTGIPFASIAGLGEGDVLQGVISYSVTMSYLAQLDAGVTTAGYGGDITTEGILMGTTVDSSEVPVSGATVTCPTCKMETYYMDTDDTDGLFTTAAANNTATDAAAGAVWLIPAPLTEQYQAVDGGAHTWPSQLAGGDAGTALIMTLIAD